MLQHKILPTVVIVYQGAKLNYIYHIELAGICMQIWNMAMYYIYYIYIYPHDFSRNLYAKLNFGIYCILYIHIPHRIGRNLYANLKHGYLCTMYTYTPMILAGICTQNSILGYTVYCILIYSIELAGICTQIIWNMAIYVLYIDIPHDFSRNLYAKLNFGKYCILHIRIPHRIGRNLYAKDHRA